VAPGMKVAAAQALARELIALERNVEREQAALAELAGWAYQFSSHVGVAARRTAARNRRQRAAVRRSRPIASRSHHRSRHARLSRCICLTRSPALRTWCSRWQRQARAGHVASPDLPPLAEADSLQRLPIELLEWDAVTNETLRALGLSTIGDLLRLPRDAFARRFGTGRLDGLDRALGVRSDPQPLYVPPAHFSARIELPADISETAQLMFPARRLLASLEGFLRGRNAGATELLFSARTARAAAQRFAPTAITLALAAPERDAAAAGGAARRTAGTRAAAGAGADARTHGRAAACVLGAQCQPAAAFRARQ